MAIDLSQVPERSRDVVEAFLKDPSAYGSWPYDRAPRADTTIYDARAHECPYCGEANAWYLSDTREVAVCLELVDYYYRLLAPYHRREALDEAVASAFSFIVLHELGHALVDVLDLPITGREEDAVDQLAVWLLLQESDGDSAVVDAAFSFLASEPWSEFGDGASPGDEHALDRQRFFNLLCWVYGSAPEAHARLIEESALPARRQAQCPREYRRLQRSWERLLAPALRPTADPNQSPTE